MKLEGRVPSVAEATQYFKDMAAGKFPRKQSGEGRSRRLFGSWYNSAQGRVQPRTTLVTPVAMDVEQAKSKLRQSGQYSDRTGGKNKRVVKKRQKGGKRVVSGGKKRLVKKGQKGGKGVVRGGKKTTATRRAKGKKTGSKAIGRGRGRKLKGGGKKSIKGGGKKSHSSLRGRGEKKKTYQDNFT